MDTLFSMRQVTLTIAPRTDSLTYLLETGLGYTRQGQYIQGLSFLILAREQLTLDQVSLASLLDTIIQGYGRYCQAQEALLQASRNFTQKDAEQQTRLAVLANLLPALEVETTDTSHPLVQPDKNSHGHASSPPQLVSQDIHSHQMRPLSQASSEERNALAGLNITCFGHFEVRRRQPPLVLCQNRNGQAILRYLMGQSGYCATTDMLMTALWPDDEPEDARHKLQVAVSALRRSLNTGYDCERGGGYILCKNQFYRINPVVPLNSDVDEFLQHYEAGRHGHGSEMLAHYQRACQLYTGPFLVEDIYADWSCRRREQLSQIYISMCGVLAEHALGAGLYENAVHWANAQLTENPCDEGAHRQLMLAYSQQGRRSEALRQYQRCERLLHDELGVEPMPETVCIFQAILTNSGM